jgi:hypothetical protein
MNIRHSRLARLATLALLGVTSVNCYAQQQGFTLRAGVEYSTGQYGGTEDIEDLYVPITGVLNTGKWGFRATVPYLEVKAPEGTEFGPGGEPLPGTGEIITQSGLGDIYLGLTYFDLYASADRRFLVDITGKVKLGTADEEKGLGTGETDYSIQLDGYRFFDGFSLFGTVGYKVRGQPSYAKLDDVWFLSLGGSLPIATRTRLGMSVNVGPSVYSDNEDLGDVSLYLSHWSQGSWRYSAYLSGGFSDSSPDMVAGFSVGYHF